MNENTTRHLVLNFIREIRNKHGKRFGEIVIAVDSDRYWRRDYFPLYKFPRKKQREDSDVDWIELKRCINVVKDELIEWFPYPVIEVPGAEADDIVGILGEWSQTNDLNGEGLFDQANPFLSVSADGDFFQLQKYKNVRQYSPRAQKFIEPDMALDRYVMEHVLTGDAGDGIPSILSPDDFFKMKEDGLVARQKPVTAKIKEFYYEQIERDGKITEFLDEEQKKRYERNYKLIHFDSIPKHVREPVIESYLAQKDTRRLKRSRLMTYMIKKQLTNIIPNLGDF